MSTPVTLFIIAVIYMVAKEFERAFKRMAEEAEAERANAAQALD